MVVGNGGTPPTNLGNFPTHPFDSGSKGEDVFEIFKALTLGDFQNNADWASKVYDNPMIDTNGDTWYGEDTGRDGVYADTIGKVVEFVTMDGILVSQIYEGPDVDFSELDGILQEEEDLNTFRPIAPAAWSA